MWSFFESLLHDVVMKIIFKKSDRILENFKYNNSKHFHHYIQGNNYIITYNSNNSKSMPSFRIEKISLISNEFEKRGLFAATNFYYDDDMNLNMNTELSGHEIYNIFSKKSVLQQLVKSYNNQTAILPINDIYVLVNKLANKFWENNKNILIKRGEQYHVLGIKNIYSINEKGKSSNYKEELVNNYFDFRNNFIEVSIRDVNNNHNINLLIKLANSLTMNLFNIQYKNLDIEY